jgi:hypothetical protein
VKFVSHPTEKDTKNYRIKVVAIGDLLLKVNDGNFVLEITYLLNVKKR